MEERGRGALRELLPCAILRTEIIVYGKEKKTVSPQTVQKI